MDDLIKQFEDQRTAIDEISESVVKLKRKIACIAVQDEETLNHINGVWLGIALGVVLLIAFS